VVFVTSRVVDQREMKRIKAKLAKYQEKAREAQKKNNMSEFKKLNKEIMSLQSKMMANSFKPMIFTMIPIILIFSWLRHYDYLAAYIKTNGYLVSLPFSLPIWGSKLNWLGWYILCSIPISTLIKKIFKLEM
jgi:uncharacterized membrane protein (DUF106 family)